MNPFINLLILFIFVGILFALNIVNINSDNYLFTKFALFILLFCFQFVLELLTKMSNNCKIYTKTLLGASVHIALLGVLGYSVCIDLKHMNLTKNIVHNITMNKKMAILCTTIIIIAVIAIAKSIELLFNFDNDKCE